MKNGIALIMQTNITKINRRNLYYHKQIMIIRYTLFVFKFAKFAFYLHK